MHRHITLQDPCFLLFQVLGQCFLNMKKFLIILTAAYKCMCISVCLLMPIFPDVDKCQTNPCLHGGTCCNTNGLYECLCLILICTCTCKYLQTWTNVRPTHVSTEGRVAIPTGRTSVCAPHSGPARTVIQVGRFMFISWNTKTSHKFL